MADRRSAIRSTDNHAEKHVAFKSPLSSVRSITPLSEMMQLENFQSPTRPKQHQQQQHQSSKRSSSGTHSGTPAKRRASFDADPFLSSNATLDDVIVKSTLRVEMVSEKTYSLGDQIPTIYEAADDTLDKTANLILSLHMLDNLMHNIVEQEKTFSQALYKFLTDVEEAEEIDDMTFADVELDDCYE